MDLRLSSLDWASLPPSDALLLLLPQASSSADEATWPEAFGALDRALGGDLSAELKRLRFRGKAGQSLVVPTAGRQPFARCIVVGVGTKAGPAELRVAAGRALRLALQQRSRRVALTFLDNANGLSPLPSLRALAEGALLASYRFERYQTKGPDSEEAGAIDELILLAPSGGAAVDQTSFRTTVLAVTKAIGRARDWVNEPPSKLTPSALASQVSALASALPVAVEVLDRNACQELGMGLFLAVSRGSEEEPRFIHLHYKPAGAKKRIALVGKGVTFDSGGLSLKTNEGMQDMKCDMAGAAAVLSATLAAAELSLPVEIHAVAACTENMPSGKAYRIGDVITSYSGKTVEINNTDAEGRLTLADALTFVLKKSPDAVIDLATLTGACVVALGPHTAAVIGNDDSLSERFIAAAARAGEDVWRLPLPPRLKEQLRSEVADMRNTGERWGGALTAGHFLQSFVEDKPWIHVDIAGPAFASKEHGHIPKGGTGFGVATLVAILETFSEEA